jgi:hypothetical protein
MVNCPTPCVKANESATGFDWVSTGFEANIMLTAMKLSMKLKSADCIDDVVLLAAELHMNADQLEKLKSDIALKRIRLPKLGTILNAKIKLDVLAMHYMAEVYRDHDVTAYDIIDSSPQGGWNFLVIRSDEFVYPRGASPLDRLKTNLGKIYTRRTLPLTCLGYGKAGIVQKLQNYVHGGMLETQDLDRWPLGPIASYIL